MKFKKLSIIALSLFTLSTATLANEVKLSANKPTKITFQIAHKNKGESVVFGQVQTVEVGKSATTISMDLSHYDLTGLVILAANGHKLPPFINQFDKPKQCSMTTDKTKSSGSIEFTSEPHKISCHTVGGIFY